MQKFVQFIFGIISISIAVVLGKLDYILFKILVDMLILGETIFSIFSLLKFFFVLFIFLTVTAILIFPIMLGIYLILDVFGIDMSDE